MKWYVWLPLLLLSLMGVVILLGALRPVEHEASVETTYPAPVEQVWDLIRDIEGWVAWHTDLKSVEPAGMTGPEGHATWVVTGRRGSMRTTITAEDPPRRLVTYSSADGFSGEWSYELSDADPAGPSPGTIVRITERGRVPSAFFRGVMTVMRHDVHAAMEAFLRELGEALGVPTQPTRIGA